MVGEILVGAFINGVGIDSEELMIDFASNSLGITYRLWIDTPIECELQSAYRNKGLENKEVDLLTINQLRHLTVIDVQLSANHDLSITFENNVHLNVSGLNPDTSCVEPWRIYQLSPENKALFIVSNK